MKSAMITGITGQDGAYLAKQLLEKEDIVYSASTPDMSGNAQVIPRTLRIGDAQKAHEQFGWAPKTSFETLCQMVVEADLARNKERMPF